MPGLMLVNGLVFVRRCQFIMQGIKEPVAFLVLGGEDSEFEQVKLALDAGFTTNINCKINLCNSIDKIHDFLEKVETDCVKVANNCILIDGKLPSEILRKLIVTFKKSSVFYSLPIFVFLPAENKAERNFCHYNLVAGVVDYPENVSELTDVFRQVIEFWINIAKLPPFAILRDETAI